MIDCLYPCSPRLLYTVPIGQNPSGLTTAEVRKRQIYDICVEFDIIIGEDDPYYILQEGEYIPPSLRRQIQSKASSSGDTVEEFIQTLEPSYLRYDYQGRVIRLDTFSKVHSSTFDHHKPNECRRPLHLVPALAGSRAILSSPKSLKGTGKFPLKLHQDLHKRWSRNL